MFTVKVSTQNYKDFSLNLVMFDKNQNQTFLEESHVD